MSDCQWCSAVRKAVCAGYAGVTNKGKGLLSLMCGPCRDRLCKKDEKGIPITFSEEEYYKILKGGQE